MMDHRHTNTNTTTNPRTEPGIPAWWTLTAILVAAFLLRLMLSPIGGYRFDLRTMAQWSSHLYSAPVSEFYAVADEPAHLPGDLWLLYGLSHLFRLLSPLLDTTDFHSPTYELFLKAVPALTDIVVAGMLFRLLRLLRNARTGLIATAAYAFNPGTIFITSIWGNWNSVASVPVLVSLELVVRGKWIWASPLWIWMILIKPQLALLVPIMLIKPLKDALVPGLHPMEHLRGLTRSLGMNIAISALLAVNTLLLLTLPFNVGLPGVSMRWSLVERTKYAADLFQLTSMNAYNLWLFINGESTRQRDTDVAVFGLDARNWGVILLICTYAVVVLLTWFKWKEVDHGTILTWAILCTTMAAFVLPTRIHSRYLFPALVLSILLAGLRPRLWWIAAGISTTFLLNNMYVYVRNNPSDIEWVLPIMASQEFLRIFSLANVLLLGAVLSLWKYFLRKQPAPQTSPRPREESSRSASNEPDYSGHSAL